VTTMLCLQMDDSVGFQHVMNLETRRDEMRRDEPIAPNSIEEARNMNRLRITKEKQTKKQNTGDRGRTG